MYDILETDLSFEYMKKLIGLCKELDFAIIGGWAIYFHVNEEYRKAFGIDYLKSRDIDVFIDSNDANKFNDIIKKNGFEKSAYFFRYELIYGRTDKHLLRIHKKACF